MKDTELSTEEEQGYRDWLHKMGQGPGMGSLDRNWTHKQYDLRGVYKRFGGVDIRGKKLPDEFKKSDEPGKKDDMMDRMKNGKADAAPWASDSDRDPGESMGQAGVPWNQGAGGM